MKTTIFGAALLYDETAESFVWLFRTFLAALLYDERACLVLLLPLA
jgi:hypothetical protein